MAPTQTATEDESMDTKEPEAEAWECLQCGHHHHPKLKTRCEKCQGWKAVSLPPGNFGLTVTILDEIGGMIVDKIHDHCQIKESIEIGDIIKTIDGKIPRSLEDLIAGNDKVRRLEIVPSKAIAAAVTAAESSGQRKKRKHSETTTESNNVSESVARRVSAMQQQQQQTAPQQNNQPAATATGDQLFSSWLNNWNNQQADSLAQHIQAWKSDGWDYRCKQLLRYKLEHNGDCNNINSHYKAPDDMTLGQWVQQQRTLYREGRLPPERIQHLRGMGFNFDHVPPTGESFTGDEYFDSRLRDLIAQHKALMIAQDRTQNDVSKVMDQQNLINQMQRSMIALQASQSSRASLSNPTPAAKNASVNNANSGSTETTSVECAYNTNDESTDIRKDGKANQSGHASSQSNPTPAAENASANNANSGSTETTTLECAYNTNHESTDIRKDGTSAGVDLTPLDETDERVHYPDGNVTLIIKKPEKSTKEIAGGKVQKIWPTTSWGFDGKGKCMKRRCVGMFTCSVQGCDYTERPRPPRSGTGKYSTKGKLPPPRNSTCRFHGDTLKHLTCKCYWFVRDKDERHWKLEHFGTHNHPKPKERKDARRMKMQSSPKKGSTNVTSDDENENVASPSKIDGDHKAGVVV